VVDVVIPSRFCGPPESGNGGWVSGLLAGFVRPSVPGARADQDTGAVSVRLASPPPLDRPLAVIPGRGGDHPASVRLLDGEVLVATATASSAPGGDLPEPATVATARAAEAAWEGLASHPFPTCFVCGTAREPGDGLGLRPGPLRDGSRRYATTWVPDAVDEPMVWAALDCPGGWSAGIAGRPMVLGTVMTRVLELPVPGDPHVVTAWPCGSRGRLHVAGTALHTADGRLLARSESVWVAVDPAVFGAPSASVASDEPASAHHEAGR
jgi:hypothetical protein